MLKMEKGQIKRKNEWIQGDTLQMMEERRRIKDRTSTEYKRMCKRIYKKCIEDKTQWFDRRCRYIEKLEEEGKTREMHGEIKNMAKKSKRRRSIMVIKDEQGKMCTTEEEIQKVWIRYVEKLYADKERRQNVDIGQDMEQAPDIIMEELEHAIRTAKNGKAVGSDLIPVEILKKLSISSKKILLKVLNGIYKAGQIPEDFTISTVIPLPKKTNAKECSDHRTISIMSHTLKLLLKIINRRIENKIENMLGNTQFGFRKKKGTRDAIALFKILIQRVISVNRKLYVAFIDYEKAFDRVRHHEMMEVLKAIRVDKEDLRLIQALYWNQNANIRIGKTSSEEFCNIERGVRQGCPLSPALFNAYSEQIGNSPKFSSAGFKVGGQRINSISYADDKVVIAETQGQLQCMINNLNKRGKNMGMTINTKKTKVMVIGKEEHNEPLQIKLEGTCLEQVRQYRYLGAMITTDGKDDKEIRCRTAMAKEAFYNFANVLKNGKIRLDIRIRILKCYVWTVYRYASETWTISKTVERRVNAFEHWCYRRILRISWTDKIRNEEVLRRIGIDGPMLLDLIQSTKRRFIDGVRKDELSRLVMQGKVPGKASRGRRRLSLFSNV